MIPRIDDERFARVVVFATKGGTLACFRLHAGEAFMLDLAEVASLMSPGTRLEAYDKFVTAKHKFLDWTVGS